MSNLFNEKEYKNNSSALNKSKQRFTKSQYELLESVVEESLLIGLKGNEAISFINSRIKDLDSDSKLFVDFFRYKRIRSKVSKKNFSAIYEIRKNNCFYIAQYLNRIRELDTLKLEAWKLYMKHRERPEIQVKCLNILNNILFSLGELYKYLPATDMAGVMIYKELNSFLYHIDAENKALFQKDKEQENEYEDIDKSDLITADMFFKTGTAKLSDKDPEAVF